MAERSLNWPSGLLTLTRPASPVIITWLLLGVTRPQLVGGSMSDRNAITNLNTDHLRSHKYRPSTPPLELLIPPTETTSTNLSQWTPASSLTTPPTTATTMPPARQAVRAPMSFRG